MVMLGSVDANKTGALAEVLWHRNCRPTQVLVVGCGSGQEAGLLGRYFDAAVVGIDISGEVFDPVAARPAILQVMDATRLGYRDGSFDLVYSFHSLEHIGDYKAALAEMARVLRPGGTFLVGTPNKSRVVGYVNSSAPARDRLRWNVEDYRRRLARQWSNEHGAHAGFTRSELLLLCAGAFGEAEDVSDDYYRKSHRRGRWAVALLERSHLKKYAYPCVYVTGLRKQDPA